MNRRTLLKILAQASMVTAFNPEVITEALANKREKLQNHLVLDLEGNPRSYGIKGNPICETTIKEAYNCTSGINNYLRLSETPALLFFTSTYCSSCKHQIKFLNEVHEDYEGRLQLVGINHLDLEGDTLAEYSRKTLESTNRDLITKNNTFENPKYPNLIMLDPFMRETLRPIVPPDKLKFPVNLLVDKNQNIIYHCGLLDEKPAQEKLITELEKII